MEETVKEMRKRERISKINYFIVENKINICYQLKGQVSYKLKLHNIPDR